MKIEEIQIPVPWGHIAARNWGDQNNEAVIVSHGFQDNAASFDRLIPLLPIHFYYISIDLPGHGLSSSYQEAGSIHYLDFLFTYKLVADYYKRAKYVLMGHSFGGTLSILFAQLYPALVSKLVIIDAIYLKSWGDVRNEAVLVIHGVVDNAGAFDNLIPHLPQHFYYICIDLPSHGKSSNLPSVLPIHTADFIAPIKIIAGYFKREKYICMGHSMGGQLLMFYAQLYPEEVSKLILLDAIYLIPFDENVFLEFTKYGLERFLKTLTQRESPKTTYTYEEAIQKLVDGRDHGQMTRAAAEPLVKRMFEKVDEDKYVLDIDWRLRYRLYPSGTMEFSCELHRKHPVNCPVLIILSTGRGLDVFCEPIYKHYVEKGYEIHKYQGHHDMHNTNPEIVAPFIINFLLKDKNKL